MTKDSWDPQQYEKFKKERSQPFFDLMEFLEPVEKAHVLDLGCGTGELTAELHRTFQAESTLGVDNSVEMLAKAHAFEGQGLSFSPADIETWSSSEKFDVIFSNAAIQWCRNHPKILRNLKEHLKPGGQLAVQMPMNHDYVTHLVAEKLALEPQWAKLLGPYEKQKEMLTVEGYAKLLYNLGFEQQNVSLKVYGHILESREDVIEWVKGTLLTYFKSRLSETAYAEFLQGFRTKLFQEIPDEKPFFYPFKRIFLWAKI
jgi:trans-aconitate 2-methyltransferase